MKALIKQEFALKGGQYEKENDYHPDYNPDEKGDAWRAMTVDLDNNAPRTKEIFDTSELIEE